MTAQNKWEEMIKKAYGKWKESRVLVFRAWIKMECYWIERFDELSDGYDGENVIFAEMSCNHQIITNFTVIRTPCQLNQCLYSKHDRQS